MDVRTPEGTAEELVAPGKGILFLSGVQNDVGATEHLNAMNAVYDEMPREISFSRARTLQNGPMKVRTGGPNVEENRRDFYRRATKSGAVRQGDRSPRM